MFLTIYRLLAPYLLPLVILITVVLVLVCTWRGEVIVGLQSDLLKNKAQEVKVIIEQHESANKVSLDYEVRKADGIKEKVYVDREVEKIVLMPSYSNECFDDTGLYSLNTYIKSFDNSTGKSKDTVSTGKGVS